jgi:hypothetical protein
MTIMAITQAKIGRFMKKRGMEKLLDLEKSPLIKGDLPLNLQFKSPQPPFFKGGEGNCALTF